ncbi:ATP-binding protein [Pedobacter sp. SL55]|uniref:ATP-binding protein n=1 Tax=Pedobacter sp. SL55 TaxID=2995161 RepID=UPI00226DAF16|nr:ATP-binding protein [Pedobacter sp. SL55]WAC42379.1 histidine kinase [Pedobacter sp. SL55]
MKYLYLLVLVFLGLTFPVFAQWDNSYQKGKVFDSLYVSYISDVKNRPAIEALLNKQYQEAKDEEVLGFIKVVKFCVTVGSGATSNEMDKFVEHVLKNYKQFPNLQARALHTVGYHYFIGELNYEKAFNSYGRLEKLLEVYNEKEITDYANYCANIITAYYKFEDFGKAIKMGKRCLKIAENKWYLYNTIGLCYKGLANVDSSFVYFGKALEEAKKKKMADVYRTIALGNIGYNYYLLKDYSKAKPLIETDLNGGLKLKDPGLISGAATPLADIFLAEGNVVKAKAMLKLARNGIAESKQLERLEKLFPVQSKYYELLGDTEQALAYRDSSIKAIKRNDSVFNGLLVMRVQQKNHLEKIAEEKSKLESYRKVSQIRLWTIVVFFFLVVLIFFIIRAYRLQRGKDKKKIEELNRIIELRERLSADMHDDVGSTLSSISLYTHSLIMQSPEDQQKSTLEKIKKNAQDVQESISDIIWSVNPNMDTMEQTIARMRAFGADLAECAGICFDFEVKGSMIVQPLTMVVRKNLYLIYKEAVNNAVKYSGGTKLVAVLDINEAGFSLKIADNGSGFDNSVVNVGNGLLNMKRRAEEIGGKLQIATALGKGTHLLLTFSGFRSS